MTDFIRVRLADIAMVKGGKRLPANASLVSSPTPHPYIRGRDIRDGKIIFDDPMYVLEEDFEKIRRYTVDSGDVCITIVGNIGDVGITPPSLHRASLTENAVKLVNLREDFDRRFLMYALHLPDVQSQMRLSASGAAQPKLGIYKVNEVQVPAPTLAIQQHIAGILSAYDELIENSEQRIKILESMARALYREWFVYFRYPGHESIPIVPSALGDIPEGWEVKPMTDFIEINPRVVVPRDGVKPFVPMGCLSNESMQITDIESREGNSGAKFQNNDTLFARITPCLENGKTGFVQFLPDAQSVAFGSTELIVLRSRTLTPEYVYLLARSDDFRSVAIKSMSGATGRQRVQQECFEDFYLAQPPLVLLDQFSAITAPAFHLVYQLHLQIQNLRATRDALLPRLISGQINVEDAA